MNNITINDILTSAFLAKYYEKFVWLSDFLMEYKDIIFQVIAIGIFLSFIASFFIVAKLLKKLYPRKIINNNKNLIKKYPIIYSFFRKTKKLRAAVAMFYKELFFIAALTPMSIFLSTLGLKNGVLIFTMNFIIASIVAKIINLVSKSIITYKTCFILLSIFILMDPSISPFASQKFAANIVFYAFSAKDISCLILSLIASFFIFKSTKSIAKYKIDKSNIDASIKIIAKYALSASCILILTFFVLKSANIDLKALTIFTGAIGVGVGLGLQKLVSRVSNGVMIILDQNMRKGDWVSIGGQDGIVRQITTRHIQLISFDGQQIYIPSESAISQTIINYTIRNYGKISEFVNIRYSKDLEKALKIMENCANKSPFLAKNDEEEFYVNAYAWEITTQGLKLRISFWIDNFSVNCNVAKSDILTRILKEFSKNEIELFESKV